MDAIDRLTGRQKDCLRLVGKGYTSKEIGRRLAISPATVDNHVRSALEVLQTPGRAEAARLLSAREHDQPLTSQPPGLASAAAKPSPADIGPRRQGWWQRLVPPLGGARNELSREGKSLAIFRVAFAGLIVLFLSTLGLATLLWALR